MKNKTIRLQKILGIIRSRRIRSQEDLAKALAESGCIVTQATLSRDLRALHVTKVAADEGGYVYIVPNSNEVKDSILTANQGPSNPNKAVGFVSLAFSGNIAVIKTRNGYAGGLAYDIDISRPQEILGTIAGADTIIAVIKEGVSRKEAVAVLRRFIPIDEEEYE